MPFAGYKNFTDCVSKHQDKRDPHAYCAAIMHQVEGKKGMQNPLPPDYHVSVAPTQKMNGDKVYGLTDFGKKKIKIATKPGEVLNTIIHEKLHANFPNMPHDQVYANASKIESKMTLPEMAQELLDVHERSMNPPFTRDMKHTEISNVIKREVK